MWHRIKDLWAHNRKLLIAFMVVICLAGFFGVRAAAQFIYWSNPDHQDQTLAGWMTPRYVSQSYNVPPQVVQSAFDMADDGPPRRVSLETLAAENGMSMEDLLQQIDDAVDAWRAARPRLNE